MQNRLVFSTIALRSNRLMPITAMVIGFALLFSSISTDGRIESNNFWQSVSDHAGDLDPTFGTSGKVRTDFFGSYDGAYALAVQSDGRIIAAGGIAEAGSNAFGLARYNFDGSLDPTFGNGGKVITHFFHSNDGIFGLAIQADEKIIAAGYTLVNFSYDFALARYNSDGSLDSSFGENGKIHTDFGGEDLANTVKILPDNKILVAGTAANGAALVRYNTNGSLDLSFGVGGRAFPAVGLVITSIVLQPDGKILGAGVTIIGEDQSFLVIRLNSDGSLDQSFGNSGKVVTDFFSDADAALDVELQTDGRIIVGGYAYGNNAINFALARYNLDGSLDTSFGVDGKAATSAGANLEDLYIQPDGRIIGAGMGFTDTADGGWTMDFTLVRFNQNGSVDSSFGVNGKVTTPFLTSADPPVGIPYATVMEAALEPNGRLVAAGYLSTYLTGDFILARYYLGFTLYDICVQDDSNGNLLRINTITGDYEFTNCGGLTISGIGSIIRRGGLTTLQHNSTDRRVLAKVDTSSNKATASLQFLSQGMTFIVTDRNIANDTCACE